MAHFTTLMPRVIDRVWDASVYAQKKAAQIDADLDGPTNTMTPAEREAERARMKAVALDLAAGAIGTEISTKLIQRRRKPKLAQGQAREAVRTVIQQFAETGISRAEIRQKVKPLLKGREISPNTLKRALFDLSQARLIFTLNSRWHPADSTILGPGRVLTLGPAPDPKGHRYKDERE